MLSISVHKDLTHTPHDNIIVDDHTIVGKQTLRTSDKTVESQVFQVETRNNKIHIRNISKFGIYEKATPNTTIIHSYGTYCVCGTTWIVFAKIDNDALVNIVDQNYNHIHSFRIKLGESYLLGRSKHAGISINDKMISKLHLKVRALEDYVELEDNRSQNGLYLYRAEITLSDLKDTKELRVGLDTFITVKKCRSLDSKNNCTEKFVDM